MDNFFSQPQPQNALYRSGAQNALAAAASSQPGTHSYRQQMLDQLNGMTPSGGAGYTDWPMIRGVAGGLGLLGYGGYQLYKLGTEEMHKKQAQEESRRAMYQDPIAFDRRASEQLDPINRMSNPFRNPNDDLPPEYLKWREGDNWDKMGTAQAMDPARRAEIQKWLNEQGIK